jgi:hypothetical protein
MTYYDDLKPYQYWGTGEMPEILNIGWLGQGHQFPTGETPTGLIEKLEEIILLCKKGKCEAIVNVMRGYFHCEFCDDSSDELRTKDENHKLGLGHSELLIPHFNIPGIYFSAPTLLHHYILKHNYLPPQGFIDSVLRFDLTMDFNGSKILQELVEKHGGRYIH